jgi:phosphoenolpyruvate-protein kinase (PTS system EI component)
MAGDPSMTITLLALGVDELSMSPVAAPEVKQVIRSIRYEEIKNLGEEILRFSSVKEATQYIREMNRRLYPD